MDTITHFEKASDGKIEAWRELSPDWWEVVGAGDTQAEALQDAERNSP